MNLRQCKKLRVGDKFRRPSTNSHDNGWREYRVISTETDSRGLVAFTVVDQHGYQSRMRLLSWKQSSKAFMSDAEAMV